jgi:hypothetical protein
MAQPYDFGHLACFLPFLGVGEELRVDVGADESAEGMVFGGVVRVCGEGELREERVGEWSWGCGRHGIFEVKAWVLKVVF